MLKIRLLFKMKDLFNGGIQASMYNLRDIIA
jgi:hypothetical protein